MGKYYWWWTDFQKKLADEAESFVDEWYPAGEKARWKREVPWDMVREMKKREIGRAHV